MLILDHAGDRAEGTVGDTPGDCSTELPCCDAPWLALGAVGNSRLVDRAEQLIEVIAIKIELPHDLGREVILANDLAARTGQSVVSPRGVAARNDRRSSTSMALATGSIVTQSAASP
jgi:hypothetical protein